MNKTFFYAHKMLALYGYRKAFSFFINAQFHQKAFVPWFDFIEKKLPENIPDDVKIRLATRPAFRFVDRKFSATGRIEALTNHYTMLTQRFSPVAVSEFLNGFQLAEITGQSGKKYVVRMESEITKEGVMRIRLMDPEANRPLAILAGVIGLDSDSQPVFMVGMLRGPGRGLNDSKQMVVDATRDMKGLRPKQAVVHAAAALAEWFHAGEIIAPSTDNQIAIMNWFKGRKILADHDTFWQEFVKDAAADGSYHLPLPLPRRNVADVQQKRRKDWLLRYEKIDGMGAEVKVTLDGLMRRSKDSIAV